MTGVVTLPSGLLVRGLVMLGGRPPEPPKPAPFVVALTGEPLLPPSVLPAVVGEPVSWRAVPLSVPPELAAAVPDPLPAASSPKFTIELARLLVGSLVTGPRGMPGAASLLMAGAAACAEWLVCGAESTLGVIAAAATAAPVTATPANGVAENTPEPEPPTGLVHHPAGAVRRTEDRAADEGARRR